MRFYSMRPSSRRDQKDREKDQIKYCFWVYLECNADQATPRQRQPNLMSFVPTAAAAGSSRSNQQVCADCVRQGHKKICAEALHVPGRVSRAEDGKHSRGQKTDTL